MTRFDYVKYDEVASAHQGTAKEAVERLEAIIDALPHSRYRALAYTALEESYMWVGKAVRDDQVQRTGSAPPQEERKNS